MFSRQPSIFRTKTLWRSFISTDETESLKSSWKLGCCFLGDEYGLGEEKGGQAAPHAKE